MTSPGRAAGLSTRFTELVGIDYPIVQTGMGWVSGPSLTSATSNAGGLGILASATMTYAELEAAIAKTKSLTDKPFGVNIRADADKENADLDAIRDPETRVNFICEKNVLAQVRSLSRNPFVVDAWRRGQSLSIHGWIYSIRDGLVRDLETTVCDADAAARLATPLPSPRRGSSSRTASRPRVPRRTEAR